MSFEDILNDRLLMQRGGYRLDKADVVKMRCQRFTLTNGVGTSVSRTVGRD